MVSADEFGDVTAARLGISAVHADEIEILIEKYQGGDGRGKESLENPGLSDQVLLCLLHFEKLCELEGDRIDEPPFFPEKGAFVTGGFFFEIEDLQGPCGCPVQKDGATLFPAGLREVLGLKFFVWQAEPRARDLRILPT
jgi:hypothetical protein